MNKEIEKKYSIKYLPENVQIQEIRNIEQAYIYKDINTTIRIRKVNEKNSNNDKTEYIYTVKTKGDIKQNNPVSEKYEIESNITKEEYDNLIRSKICNKILKTRLVIPIQNNLKVEADIYHDYLEELLTAEIEFPNIDDANKFKKPGWLGKELSYKELSNRRLSEMNRDEFKSKVSEEFLENNIKIIKELEKII